VDAAGLSLTKVPGVTIEDLLAEPFVVIVHQSAAEITTVVACGNLKAPGEVAAVASPTAAGGTGGTGGTTTATADIPAVGVGSAFEAEGANTTVVLLLGAVALCLAGAGVGLRRREEGG
jgi:hypothetical protein